MTDLATRACFSVALLNSFHSAKLVSVSTMWEKSGLVKYTFKAIYRSHTQRSDQFSGSCQCIMLPDIKYISLETIQIGQFLFYVGAIGIT